ncbi:hypothetical protein, partial [Klebsiella pneumoniae]
KLIYDNGTHPSGHGLQIIVGRDIGRHGVDEITEGSKPHPVLDGSASRPSHDNRGVDLDRGDSSEDADVDDPGHIAQ